MEGNCTSKSSRMSIPVIFWILSEIMLSNTSEQIPKKGFFKQYSIVIFVKLHRQSVPERKEGRKEGIGSFHSQRKI